jgi:peptidoglycan/xylan/chitin deacetylase (PgdA/CDA1 family)
MVTYARILTAMLLASLATGQTKVQDRLVVLTFDDSVKSHYTVARGVLKEYGFGATFFVTEGLNCRAKPDVCMSWEEIRTLHKDGFEIGNHTRDHMGVKPENVSALAEQLRYIDEQCARMGILKPVSFAWPGNGIAMEALPALKKHGILFGRRGGYPEYPTQTGLGVAYEPGRDHPHLIPSVAVPRPGWTLQTFQEAVNKAGSGQVAVIQFHGVPETEHPWVHTPPELFKQYMRYLREIGSKVIALRDLPRFVNMEVIPVDPWEIINLRRRLLSQGAEEPR